MSTMFYCCGSSGRLGIVDMLAVTFVFKTSGFPPFVLLVRLCHESHVRPLLDFRLGSYEPYRKFPTYFVGVFCSNLEGILSCVYIGNFRYISEIYDIICRLFLFQLRVYVVIYIGQISLQISSKKRCYKINNIFPNGAP